MAQFNDHINQSKRNLEFLEQINSHCKDHFDWQVTVCFYAALHLVNAHLSKFDLQYRKHKDVKDILNPFSRLSLAKLPETEYQSYIKLQSLSRRARYLVNEKDNHLADDIAHLTYDKHLQKSIKHLDILMQYFSTRYDFTLPTIKLHCVDLKYSDLTFVETTTV